MVVAAAAGALRGGGSSAATRAPNTDSASAGAIELSFPSTWARSASTPTIAGLALANPIALATASGTTSSLLAGTTTATGPALLPSTFIAQVSGSLPTPTSVRLGTVDALRYSGVSVRGAAQPLILYVIPTSAGVVTVGCSGPATAAQTIACQRIAGTLRLTTASAYALGPSASYASALAQTFKTLQGAAAPGQAALAAAKTPGAQAAAAGRLASAYAAAGRSLAGQQLSPAAAGINAQLATALASVASDYARAEHAASRNDATGYRLAATAIGRDGTLVTSALGALRASGYSASG